MSNKINFSVTHYGNYSLHNSAAAKTGYVIQVKQASNKYLKQFSNY